MLAIYIVGFIGGTRDEVSTRGIKLLLLEFVVSCVPCQLELYRCLEFSRHQLPPTDGELNPTPFGAFEALFLPTLTWSRQEVTPPL